jgi:N-acetylmuramoyl-L-alanine amidase
VTLPLRLRLPLLPAALFAATAAWAQTAPPPLLDVLAPSAQAAPTTREFVNLLGRTAPDAQLRVAGEPAPVYRTGIFVRDRLPLALGLNTFTLEATGADGQVTVRTLQVERVAPPAPAQWPADRLWLDGSSLRPDQAQRVAPGEPVEVAVRATPGQQVQARLPGQGWQPLAEASPGRYRAALVFSTSRDVEPAPVMLRVLAQALPATAQRPGRAAPRASATRPPASVLAQTPGAAGQWRADPERLHVVGPEGATLLHGVHEVRLGGPNLTELPAGTMLAARAQRGEHLQVQLSPDTTAWVAQTAVAPAAPGTPVPRVHFTTLSLNGQPEGDVLQVPLAAAVPYAVRAVAGSGGQHHLEVDIYGAHHATTWITHRANARVVREVTADQAGPGRVRLTVALQQPRLWGWRVERMATALRIVLRAAPLLATRNPGSGPGPGSPLAGLRVALEAGHGGPSNLGAVGATGTPEKDINRWTVDALQAELQAAGAQVVMIREGDDNPPLRERARRAEAADAHLFISVHGNAADTGGGYLRVGGTSTYYKHATGRDLAAAVQQRLLARTGLADFGLVGNFNYAPIRLATWMPSVLVEQAFLSNPADEAQLLDPAFRAQLAQAVRQGLEDFVRAALPGPR